MSTGLSFKGEKVLILGSGSFGTCLGHHLGKLGHSVNLWTRSKEEADAINKTHVHPVHHSTVTLSKNIHASTMVGHQALEGVRSVVQATPFQSLRDVLSVWKPYWREDLRLIVASKGIEMGSLALPTQVVEQVLGKVAASRAAFLSGPSFAAEVMEGQPTAVTCASYEDQSAKSAQLLFHSSSFRVYTSTDPVGLEMCGALKNVIAIASGAACGLGYGANTQAALVTRGLSEITRLGLSLGAQPMTFNGLGGVGDLFLTCSSRKSRNFSLGFLLAQGLSTRQALEEVGTAEGYTTAAAAKSLSERQRVETPIIDQVYEVLYDGKRVTDAVSFLVNREAKSE